MGIPRKAAGPARASKICASIARDQAQDYGENYRANDGDDDAADHSVRACGAESQAAGDKSAHECAYQADDHIHEEAKARPLHDLSRKPACDDSDDDPCDPSMTHIFFPPWRLFDL